MDQVEQELVCCVCLDLYETPVLLPCSHNLCKKCARGLSNSSGVTRRIFDCPKCRHEIRLSSELGLDGLPENLTLKSIVSVVRKQKKTESQADKLVKLCLKHDRLQDYYCRSCRTVICELCLKEGHLGFGHIVSETKDVLEEEQEKADACSAELKGVIDSLETQHQNIIKKKEKIAHFERNIQKSLDYDFQQLILSVNMTKLSLTCGLQKLLKECKDTTRREEAKCQELLADTAQLTKMLKATSSASTMEKNIQKLEKFVMKETGLMAFKLNGHTYDVTDDIIPPLKVTGVEAIKEAISAVQWSSTDTDEHATFKHPDSAETKSSDKPKPAEPLVESSQKTPTTHSNGHVASDPDDMWKSDQSQTRSLKEMVRDVNATNTQPESDVTKVPTSTASVTSLFGLCCRSRRPDPGMMYNTSSMSFSTPKVSSGVSKDFLNEGLNSLAIGHSRQEKYCTKHKTCEAEKNHVASNPTPPKTLLYHSAGACKKHPVRSSLVHGQSSDSVDKNGNKSDKTVCPVTESNRPLFTVASSRDNQAEFQALCKSSCNHSNHSEKPFFEFADRRVLHNVVSHHDNPPKMAPLSVYTENPEATHNGAASSEAEPTQPKSPLFQPVTNQEATSNQNPSGSLQPFFFGSYDTRQKDDDQTSSSHRNTINHAESSPFRATDFFKSMSDPGSVHRIAHGDHEQLISYASPLSPTDDSGTSDNDSPPFIVSSEKPGLFKSKSAGAKPSRSSSASTSPKALFTIGLSLSPRAGKRPIKRSTRNLSSKK